MDACQALPLLSSTPPLPCDLYGGADLSSVDGGAVSDQRPSAELLSLPPAVALKSHLPPPLLNGEASVPSPGSSGSSEDDARCRLGDFLSCESLPDDEDKDGASEASSGASDTTPRSCLRRCRPARRRSDSAASHHAIAVRRRGSEAPPPRPRRVHFPSTPVTALIPAADPLRLLGSGDVTSAYLAACERHGSRPLPEVLHQLSDPAADVLRLSGVPLTLADVDSLEEVLRRRQWQRVDAADCALRGETLSALLQIVTHYDAAPWLNLAGAGSDRLGWTAVCGAVRGAGRTSALQWLSLDRSAPSEVAAAALGRSLRDCRLRVLHLERCHLHGRPLLTLLAAGLRAATGLRQLYLGDNDLGSGDGSLLGAALKQNSSLQLLDLRNNALDDDAAGYLLSGLAEQRPAAPHTGLLTLNLWHNRLTRDSAAPLAALLAAHPALETLNLGDNPLEDSTAVLLEEPLTRPGPLRRLGLQRCRLGDDAAAALGRALAAGSGLVRLDLRGNKLGAVGMRALLTGVEGNVLLRQLDLDQEEPAPEPATEAILGAVPESVQESGPEPEHCRKGVDSSPERADSGIDSPAKLANGGGGGGGACGAEYSDTDGAALGTSADSTLGSSAGSNPSAFPAVSASGRGSADGGESVGLDSDSESAPGDEYRSLLSALAAVCEANRQQPAPELPSPPAVALAEIETEDEPPSGHWLRRRLSAALRRVSLTCETPPRLAASAAAAAATAPAPAAAAAISASTAASSSSSAAPSSAQPVPVPDRPRHRRMVSPSPSPSESPLPSPTSGRSRFRVFRVSSAEPLPGTPPLTRGLPRPSCERTPSPSLSRDVSPLPPEVDVSTSMRKDSIALSRERSHRPRAPDGSPCSERSAGDSRSFDTSPCDASQGRWREDSHLSAPNPWCGGDLSPLGDSSWTPRTPSPSSAADWTRTPSPGPSRSTLSPDSGLGEASQWQGGGGGGESPTRRSVPRSSPRPAGRKFRVTPVRETPGPA